MDVNDAVIYTRMSLDRTGAGVGVDGQERDGRAYAGKLGLTVRRVYSDNDITASGRKMRPGYRQMLADLQCHPATVIVWHTDRLTRSMAELEEYITLSERHGIVTRAVQAGDLDLATASGRMVARLLGAVARHELEHMAERRVAAKQRQAEAGAYRGGPRPIGYEADGVTLRLAEAERIRQAARDLIAGRTLYAIVRAWNAGGFTTSTGKRWAARQAGRVLTRARNAGLVEHDGEIIGPAQWPAIISEDELRAVRSILGKNRPPGGRFPVRSYLLSGVAICAVCGDTLVTSKSGGRAVYRCRRAAGEGGHVTRTVADLDAYVTGVTRGILQRLGPIKAEGPDLSLLHKRLADVNTELDELAEARRRREITTRQLILATGDLETEKREIEQAIADAMTESAMAPFAVGRDPGEVFDSLDTDRQRRVIERLMAGIIVRPAPGGRPKGWQPGMSYFDDSYVRLVPA